MRIAHISDLHFWQITLNPRLLAGKRFLGMGNLLLNRAWKYRMDTMPALVQRIREIEPDHLLITGDLTTTALEEEFRAVREALEPLAPKPSSLTVIPGNHDRYTRESMRGRVFERYFAEFAPSEGYPWLKSIGEGTGVLGLDPTHPNPISALGTITLEHLRQAARLLDEAVPRIERLLIACHYPVALPAGIIDGRGHGLRGCRDLHAFLARWSPNLYCHGHVHASWAFSPNTLPRTLCLDPGAALKVRRRSGVHASMFEIVLDGDAVEVRRHALREGAWRVETVARVPQFFNGASPVVSPPSRSVESKG